MSTSYSDPGARELARRLSALSSGKVSPGANEPGGHRVTVSESPQERLAHLGQIAMNVAPLVLPVLGRLVPKARKPEERATPVPKARRRRRFFSRWRLFRIAALVAGVWFLESRTRARTGNPGVK